MSVTVYVIVPSARLLTLMPEINQVPLDATVVVAAVVLLAPLLATTEIASPAVPVPLIEVAVWFEALIGLVTDVIARFTPTFSVNACASCTEAVLSSAWATRLIVPVNPLAGVSVTVAVLPLPGVTCTVTFDGVAVKLLVPVTLNVGVWP